MNWDMLGAIAELLGAMGVIATLGYLAVQVRANTTAVRREAEQETFDGVRDQLAQVATDKDLARIYRTGLNGMEHLDPDEQTRLGAFLLEVTYYWLRVYWLAQDGKVNPEIAESNWRARRDIVTTPGYRQWYEGRKHWLPDGFRKEIEREMHAGPGPSDGSGAGPESEGR